MKVINVVGARPNFMKIAPIIRAIATYNNSYHLSPITLHHLLVHTGQHYDYEMSKVFFKDLELPEPDIYLGVGSGTHAEQTGKVMIEFEKVLFKERPDLVIVVGDVNSTLACALAASKTYYSKKLGVNSGKVDAVKNEQISVNNLTNSKNPINAINARGYRPLIAHVEAGLRSFDRTMPEEINRLLTDQISDFLFTPSPDADENLKKEGIPEDKIFLVGNVMVDSLLFNLEKAKKSQILEKLDLARNLQSAIPGPCSAEQTSLGSNPQSARPTAYCLLTLHRPSNVDDKDSFLRIINALTEISKHIPIIFPIHPRTRKQIEAFGFEPYFVSLTNNQSPITNNRIYLVDPLGYLDFLNLMMHSTFVMTDSGGIQEETTVLGIPCLTLRDTTERPITISQGTNVLVWNDTQKIIDEAFKILDRKGKTGNHPELWDGKAAERIVEVLLKE
jgi:UDP-N-acetylglucosamine 2-epimerase (non-hydrolysing)